MSKFIKNIPLLQLLTGSLRFKSKSQCKPKPPKKQGKKKPKGEEASSPAMLFRSIALFGALPSLLILAAWVFTHIEEHERPEFKKYEHLRLRHKPFPWGEGEKSFFHNRNFNALPEGYEDEIERREQERLEQERLEQEMKDKKKKK